MARKIIPYSVTTEGRDNGKLFMLHEMPSRQAEWWGARVLSAMARSNPEIPPDIASAGLQGIAAIGVHAVLGALGQPEMKVLLDEMFESCVAIVPEPKKPAVTRGAKGIAPLVDDDIEELATLAALRREVLLMHVGFLPAAVRLSLETLLQKMKVASSPNT